MREEVIRNFTKAFFVGVVNISFFEMGGKRNMKISFNEDEDFEESLNRSKEASISKIFLINKKDKSFMSNRDDYETAMYMTAARGAMEAWTKDFEDMVEKEREGDEDGDS